MTGAPVVVWGAGAMGGSLAAWWIREGVPVTLVDVDLRHVETIRERGLQITGPVDEFSVPARIVTPRELVRDGGLPPSGGAGVPGRLHRVFLAVKAHHTPEALRDLAPLLAEDGFVVSVQNGLNERVIADAVGRARTVGCFVNFGADVVEPGVVMRGNRGAVVVGELDGSDTSRIREVHRLMTLFDPGAVRSGNILGYLWGKLAYGAILFATALTDASIADVLDAPRHRPVLVELGREVVRVALARNIVPEAFDGFDPGAFHPDAALDEARESLDRLVAFNRASAKSHSGVWRDMAVRKRKTEVDAQIAPIGVLGREVGVATPTVDRLVQLIHDVEAGRRPRAWATLEALGR